MFLPPDWRRATQKAFGCWLGLFCLIAAVALVAVAIALIVGA